MLHAKLSRENCEGLSVFADELAYFFGLVCCSLGWDGKLALEYMSSEYEKATREQPDSD